MKQSSSLVFVIYCSIVLIICFGGYFTALHLFEINPASYDYSIFAVVYAGTAVSYIITAKISDIDPSYFMIAVMVSIVLRLLLYTTANFVMIYFDSENATPNVILFFSLYVLFTALETMELFKRLNSKQS